MILDDHDQNSCTIISSKKTGKKEPQNKYNKNIKTYTSKKNSTETKNIDKDEFFRDILFDNKNEFNHIKENGKAND